jgi:hypothetical protein
VADVVYLVLGLWFALFVVCLSPLVFLSIAYEHT